MKQEKVERTIQAKPGKKSTNEITASLRSEPTCYNYYRVYYDNTGAEVGRDFLYSNCMDGDGGSGESGSWEGGSSRDGGGTGGNGGSGGGDSDDTNTITATTVLVVPPDIPVTDIKQYLKCFDTNQPATLTVYARQPSLGTTDTWSINGGVGHSFISISQNGITRVFGFYPTSKVAIVSDSPGIFGDNSQTAYTVSISKQIFGGNLYSLLQYTYVKANATYSLPIYNCTDFAIGAAAAAGLNLPDTWGQWGVISGGSNPGNFGQDINTMPLPAGTQREGGGISPANTGGC